MEGDAQQNLIRKAAQVINPKIKKYKFDEVENILKSEFPVDEFVTDTLMSSLCLACSLPDNTEDKQPKNQRLMGIILKQKPDINFKDMFERSPLHHAALNGNMTATSILIEYGITSA